MPENEVLLVDPQMARVQDALSAVFDVHLLQSASEAAGMPDTLKQQIRGIAWAGHIPFDGSWMDQFPNLEIVANFGVGYDNIDAVEAARRGILVTNTPDVLTEEVADTALGLMIMTARELSAAERWLRAGNWKQPYPLTRGTLRNKTLGIFGLGRIGKAIAQRAQALGLSVLFHNRNSDPQVPYEYCASLTELAQRSDILLSAAPGGPATQGMIDAAVFEALGSEGIFINIGRGSVVDETALINALRNRTIMAAGLDVYTNEPQVPAELIEMDHVVLLPHVASASVDTRNAMGQLQADNIIHWFHKGSPLTPVAETPWPRTQPLGD